MIYINLMGFRIDTHPQICKNFFVIFLKRKLYTENVAKDKTLNGFFL